MSGIVLTFPIVTGKVEAWRRFCQELSGLSAKDVRSIAPALGITRERLVLVETAFGSTAVDHPGSPQHGPGAGSDHHFGSPFDVWYRERLQELHGVNLAGYEKFSQPTPTPHNQELLFEWRLNSSVGG